MEKHILVTTDFSTQAEWAYAYAREQAELCRQLGVRVTLVAVLDRDLALTAAEYDFSYVDADTAWDALHERATERMGRIVEEHFDGFNTKIELLPSNKAVYLKIVEYAEEHAVDLIVLATRGRTGIDQLLLGSVAEKVVRHASCPVLVVPGGRKEEELDELTEE